jgi:hypothetical protein
MHLTSTFTDARHVRRLMGSVILLTLLAFAGACGSSDNEEPEIASNPEPTVFIIEPTATPEPESTSTPEPVAEPTATPEPAATESPEPTEEPDVPEPTATPEPELEPLNIPDSAFLGNMRHMYQTFNNCSAASVCMLLSHYDIVMDQETLRPIMRPNDGTRHGKNEYMIGFLREQGFHAQLMHGGDVETIQAFIAHEIPVIVQQWLDIDSDPIGHYSVVRGYDNSAGVFRLNDSMHGEDFRISYGEFTAKWRAFSYRYIPVWAPQQQEIVERILGEQIDLTVNRERSLERIQAELQERPNDAELLYSLGTNLHDLGRYAEAIEAYERAASIGLPPKMLWYVYWPVEAYNEIGRHDRALQVAEQQLTTAPVFGDMRYERARALEAMGETNRAIAEYRQTLIDDPRLTRAEEALIRLGAL